MQILISVATAEEARAALEGGADIVDAKDPHAGALGPVTLERLREIRAAVGSTRPVTAALGDANDPSATEALARAFAAAGSSFVKVGLLGVTSTERAHELATAAVRGASLAGGGVVLVAYADAPIASLPQTATIEVAARAGARGVLLDTMDKTGPPLFGAMTQDEVRRWVDAAKAARLLVALAGKLDACHLSTVAEAGADIAGFRGAACDGDRNARISTARVRVLQDRARQIVRAATRLARSSANTTRLSTPAGNAVP